MKKLILSFAVILTVMITAMSFRFNPGPSKSEFRKMDVFTGITLRVPAEVYIKQGAEQSLRIEAEEDALSQITTEVKKGSLEIDHKKTLRDFNKIKIYITLAELENVRINGSGNITGATLVRGGNLNIAISGSSNVKMALDYNNLDLKISGSGDMELTGKAISQQISIAGSGDINSVNLESEKAKVSIAGSGSCTLDTKYLNANIAGSGSVFYKNIPAQISKSISGSGSLKALKS